MSIGRVYFLLCGIAVASRARVVRSTKMQASHFCLPRYRSAWHLLLYRRALTAENPVQRAKPGNQMITIRKATAADAGIIFRYICELAEYEKAPEAVVTTEAGIREAMFGPEAVTRALVCSINGQDVGFAVYFYNFSTWLGRKGIYLEDLYVTPEHRGKGAGKALLQHIAGIAVAENCGRFEWSVLDWNRPSIDFYEALGARPQSEWITYRLTGAALQHQGERGAAAQKCKP
jgi:GNAT superfamily N-acetyltransferase